MVHMYTKAYASRTLPVKDYGKVTTLEFDGLGHFADTVAASLQTPYQWQGKHDGFRAGSDPSLGFKEAVAAAYSGLDSLVPASDKLIDKLEAMLPDMSLKAFEIERNTIGALPHIPAYLKGDPRNMLQRRRTLKQEAPLAIFLDLISTCNVTNAQHMTKGSAILALVRILSTRRPVTLYAGMQCDTHRKRNACAMLYFPVDTAPLDLARAAWLTAHQSAVRGLMYQFCKQEVAYHGHWAWEDDKLHRDRGQDVTRVVTGCEEVLYIPPAQSQDTDFQVMTSDPARWLVERVMKYGKHGIGEEAA